jgi:hypothetical protein
MNMVQDELEYFTFFSGEGQFKVNVKFESSDSSIATTSASSTDIARLLDLINSDENYVMTFDEHPGVITSINIDVVHRKVQLFVRLIENDLDYMNK